MTLTVPDPFCLTSSDALFLDFDGTLTPLQDDPDAVYLAANMEAVLVDLSAALGGALAILSGRDVADLALRVPRALWRLGNHGLYAAAPGQAAGATAAGPDAKILSAVEQVVRTNPPARLEVKGPVLAIHYRAAPQLEEALKAGLARALTPFQGYRWQHGKCVLEAKPIDANKGRALTKMLRSAPFAGRRPVMMGDDTTDEDAFVAAQQLGGLAIKVGGGQTAADFRLPDVASVHSFLKKAFL